MGHPTSLLMSATKDHLSHPWFPWVLSRHVGSCQPGPQDDSPTQPHSKAICKCLGIRHSTTPLCIGLLVAAITSPQARKPRVRCLFLKVVVLRRPKPRCQDVFVSLDDSRDESLPVSSFLWLLSYSWLASMSLSSSSHALSPWVTSHSLVRRK